MRNKRERVYVIISLLMIAVALIISCYLFISLRSKVVVLDDESFFDKYEVIDNEVHIYCIVSLKNNSSDSKKVKLLGDFQEEVNIGLLKEDTLEAYFVEDASSTIVIKGNSTIKYIKVEFVGEYAGNAIMSNRLLPKIEVIEID